MAKTRLAGVIFCCLLATSGWAETPNPSLITTPTQPTWSDLTVPQRIVLAPLSDDWDAMENYRQKKWLGIAARFPSMAPEEQRRILGQMQQWGKLTPEQRQKAREQYKAAKQLPTDKQEEFKRKWKEYLSLPPEEREKFKQQAESKPVILPVQPTQLPQPTAPALVPTLAPTAPAAAAPPTGETPPPSHP